MVERQETRSLESCATSRRVSPGSAGLKAGVGTPGFGHAEVSGDTRMFSCVMKRRIRKH
jgi:hypothetical protein